MKWEINETRTHDTSWIMTCHDTRQLNMIPVETSRVTKDSSRFLASVSWNKCCKQNVAIENLNLFNLAFKVSEQWKPVLAPNTAHNLRAFSALNNLLTDYSMSYILKNYTIQNIEISFHNFQNSKIQAHSFSRNKASICCNSGCA